MAMAVDFKTNADQACRAAEEFVNIYYETIDKRRRVLTRLYLDTATLVWNGNAISGLNALNEFFETLPSSEFQINVVDCQPVHVLFLDDEFPSKKSLPGSKVNEMGSKHHVKYRLSVV
ncbi:NTF2-related export protein 2-like isoform X2 [Antechinus flavipes]|uniref:NTF2-related export protein 2-like isoform X2 n=1 Tax=Antechinus flavipes TaxID=38775 RepID=UPI002235B680|nr:NTF2-related export protein 2-like isoform X2 [Antechinus flavipes]